MRMPSQEPAHAPRYRQNPLSDCDLGKYTVNPGGRPLGHPSPGAAWTERSPLTGPRHQAMHVAGCTSEPGKAVGELSTGQVVLELAPDEAGQRSLGILQLLPQLGQALLDDLAQHAIGAPAKVQLHEGRQASRLPDNDAQQTWVLASSGDGRRSPNEGKHSPNLDKTAVDKCRMWARQVYGSLYGFRPQTPALTRTHPTKSPRPAATSPSACSP